MAKINSSYSIQCVPENGMQLFNYSQLNYFAMDLKIDSPKMFPYMSSFDPGSFTGIEPHMTENHSIL